MLSVASAKYHTSNEAVAFADGVDDTEQLFVTLEPQESFYFVVPVRDENHQEVLGAVLVYMQHLPTTNDIPETLLLLLGRSVLILLLAAGLNTLLPKELTSISADQR